MDDLSSKGISSILQSKNKATSLQSVEVYNHLSITRPLIEVN